MLKGKISVIIPVYNTVAYIERCVRSVMKQTYDDLEIICVDDGSTDGSGSVLDALAKEDSRIVVVHKENAGVSAARNEALSRVTGDYITFVDSDDYIDECMYEKMLDKLSEEDADIVTCGYAFDYEGVIKAAKNIKRVPGQAMSSREFLPYIYERDTYKGVGGYLWTRLIKRDVIFGGETKPQIRFDSEFGGADDIVFVAQLTANSDKTVYLEDPLYYYFQREGSIVHDDKKQLETMHWLKSYEKIMDIYQERNWFQVIPIIERMYVYRCGKTLELAIKFEDADRAQIIKEKIRPKLPVYVETNLEHLDRVKWLLDLMLWEE